MQPNQPHTSTPNQDPNETPPNNQPESLNTWNAPAQSATPPQGTQPQQPTSLAQSNQPSSQDPPTPRKSHKGLLLIGGAVAVVILAATAGAYAWMQQQNDPQQRLYRALESHMETSYIQQDYTQLVTRTASATAHVNGTSDFTDPKSPKSYLNYSRTIDSSSEVAAAGELVIINKPEYFARASKLYSVSYGGVRNNPVADQWYQIGAKDYLADLVLDPMGLAGEVNISTGEYLVGNFNETTRSELMNFIKTQNVYTINSSEDVTVDGEKMTKYNLTINSDRVNELNDKAVELLGLEKGTKKEIVKITDDQTNTLWVSRKTGRIAQTERTRDSPATKEDGSKILDVNTVKISYPTSVSKITKPSDSINWE